MSGGLTALLAGREAAGVYRWASAQEPDEVRETVESGGQRFAHVDGWTLAGRREVLVAIGEALELPSWYGANLDALHDCLRDLSGPTVLLWDGWGVLARADDRGFRSVAAVLGEHADRLTTLLRGGGPESGVPLLA